jgi:DNA-binding GntR family transcriptional regulator
VPQPEPTAQITLDHKTRRHPSTVSIPRATPPRFKDGTTVEFVAANLRQAILSGSMAPEQRLSLRKIAARLGVSLIPVREALRSLEGEGLLETRPGRSAVVTRLSLEELSSICRLCRQIEPDIRVRAATVLTPGTLDRLTALVDKTSGNTTPTDDNYARHHELHTELVRPATTASELRILHQLWRALERYLRASHRNGTDTPGRQLLNTQSTYELLAAYRANDPGAVRLATLARLDGQERTAQRAVPSDSAPARHPQMAMK